MQLIRNHAEVVVDGKGNEDILNMVGHNFRLGEIECAMGSEQLKKLPRLIKERQVPAYALSEQLKDLDGLHLPYIPDDRDHAFYVYPMRLDLEKLKVSRDKICDALEAEGVSLMRGYQNIHLLPIYQKKIAFGSSGFPWNSEFCNREISYKKGICPVAEDLHDNSFIGILFCHYDLCLDDIELIGEAFRKVWKNLNSL